MYYFLKRLSDILVSFIILIILSPLFLLISIAIFFFMGSPVFFLQERMGLNYLPFKIIKFRTMINNSDKDGLGITASGDKRITKIGMFLRKFKLDELPQFLNVLFGDMSIVGPRPEIKKYVDLFRHEYRLILEIRPGITDPASIKFRNESAILEKAENKEEVYINEILPEKIKLNKLYLLERNFLYDVKIIFSTFVSIFK